MKTDTIFYRLFQTLPSIFFELINQPPETAANYQFSSVEIKQLAFRIDGVFLPSFERQDEPIYFLEVQFQLEPKFYSRFFAEIFLYLDKTELTNDWRGVVVYPTRSVESTQTSRYQELLDSQLVSRIYLDELGNTTEQSIGIETVKLVIEPEENAGIKAKELINKARQDIADEQAKRELIQLIETILIYKLPKKSREEIEQMLGLSELKQTKVYQEAKEEGKLEGKQEGKLEGKQEGKLETVPLLLSLGASVEQIAEALNLDVEAVQQAAQQQLSSD